MNSGIHRISAGVLVVALLMGCSETLTSDAEGVASVTISGAPGTPVLVGATLQLAATLLNETGVTISGNVSWKTSDGEIATVNSGGRVTAVGAGRVTITATSGRSSGSVVLDVRAGGPVGSEGATLTMLGGLATLVIPPGSFTQATTILVTPANAPPGDARLIPGTAIEVGPEPVTFVRGATLTLVYDRTRLPANVPHVSLQLYSVSNGVWAQVRGSTVDTIARKVTGTITRTGTYAVVGTPVERVALGGPLFSGALFVGQSGQLQATAYDPLNTALANRVFTWQSSDVSRARVDASGTVTAVGVGSVVITATSEGKSANTTLTILTRPNADWSSAAEWGTYQANARHTGYVPVTADAVVFQELWVKQPFGTAALNPVTEGQGRVYASTNAYFGSQQMGALDLRTGVTNWSRDFGGIHGVHPPAYANGSVYVTTSGHEDSFLYGIEAATGTVRFRSGYGNQWSRYYAPVIIGDVLYMAGGYYDGMYSFDTTQGTQRWFAASSQYNEWTPAVDNGRVYVYTGEYSPKVSVHDASTGNPVFTIADPEFSWSGWSMHLAPVLGGRNNLLATNGGRLISFDLQARNIGWQQKASFTGTVTVAAGQLYVVNNGQVDVRNETDGTLVAPWIPPEGRVQPPVFVTRNLLFASTEANTYAVDLTTRKQVWSYPAGGKLALSGQGVLFIAQNNGKLAAISVKQP